MASIQKIENKKGVSYKVRVCCGYDAEGKKLTQGTTFIPDQSASAKQKEKAAYKFAMEFEEKVKNGTCFDGEKTTFETFSAEWLKCVKNDVSYNTYKCYEMMLRTKIVPYFKSYKLAKIKLPMIESFYFTLVNDLAQGSMKKIDMILNVMFKTAIRWQMIEKNPCDGAVMPKSKKRAEGLKFFTPEQARAFLASLDMDLTTTYQGHKRTDDTGKQYMVEDYTERRRMPLQLKIFFYIAMTCGLRRGEILALRWSDLDFENETISITKSVSQSDEGVECKEPKTKTSVRTIPIPEVLVPLLLQYKSQYNRLKISLGDRWKGEDNIFIQADGKLMGMSTPYQRFIRHIAWYNEWVSRSNAALSEEGQGLEPLPKIPLHGLRHTCATLLNDMGTNISVISKILGHAQTSTTMNIYAHSFESQLREASDNMNGFLQKCAEEENIKKAAI